MSAFQAEEVGSIPITRSTSHLSGEFFLIAPAVLASDFYGRPLLERVFLC